MILVEMFLHLHDIDRKSLRRSLLIISHMKSIYDALPINLMLCLMIMCLENIGDNESLMTIEFAKMYEFEKMSVVFFLLVHKSLAYIKYAGNRSKDKRN